MTGSREGNDSGDTLRVVSGDPWLGRVLKNKYQLERLLGTGGFGAVYAARQVLMGTWHAVKLLHGPSGSQPELVDRFREEARIGTQLRHARIVAVTDFDVEGGTFFLVMDFIDSVTLAQRLRQAPGDAGRQIDPWARDIAAALDYAHAQRVIHRDLKPSNILIRDQDQAALLTDFGISRWLHSIGVTQAGTTLGTYAYMSPEQCVGEERAIDARSDIYSLAALLFELECGRPPFGTGQEAMNAHVHQPAPSVRQFRADHRAAAQLDAVFSWGLAKSPNQRPQSAQELAEQFLAARAQASTPERPPDATVSPPLAKHLGPVPLATSTPITAMVPSGTPVRPSTDLPPATAVPAGPGRTATGTPVPPAAVAVASVGQRKKFMLGGAIGGLIVLGVILGVIFYVSRPHTMAGEILSTNPSASNPFTSASALPLGQAMTNPDMHSVVVKSFQRDYASIGGVAVPPADKECIQVTLDLSNGSGSEWSLPLYEMQLVDSHGQKYGKTIGCGGSKDEDSVPAVVASGHVTARTLFEVPKGVPVSFTWSQSSASSVTPLK